MSDAFTALNENRPRKLLNTRTNKSNGAEEGTRTPTPLRVHGPEPCASANSATSASDLMRGGRSRLEGRDYDVYSYKARTECQTLPETLPRSMPPLTDLGRVSGKV